MKPGSHPPRLVSPAQFVYRYWPRLLGWLLEEHGALRERLIRFWPKAIRRDLLVTERVAEIPFVMRALDLPKGCRVLDVGSRWSPLPLFMAGLGYRTVAFDLEEVPLGLAGPSFVRGDIRRSPFRPGSFDSATVVSTLEHIGIAAYDGRRDLEDDLLVLRELRGLLRPGGILVLTVPYGRPRIGRRQRVYDRERIERVTTGWTIDRRIYCIRRGSSWGEATEAEASVEDSAEETRAVVLIRARRP